MNRGPDGRFAPSVRPLTPLIPTSVPTHRRMADCPARIGSTSCDVHVRPTRLVWGGVRTGRLHAAFVVTSPLPVTAGAALPYLLHAVAPALVRGPRAPLALRARGALPSFSVRLRRRAGGPVSRAGG